jgi:hypothetical protein
MKKSGCTTICVRYLFSSDFFRISDFSDLVRLIPTYSDLFRLLHFSSDLFIRSRYFLIQR